MLTTAIMPLFIFNVIFNDNINIVKNKLQPVVLFTPMLNVMIIQNLCLIMYQVGMITKHSDQHVNKFTDNDY